VRNYRRLSAGLLCTVFITRVRRTAWRESRRAHDGGRGEAGAPRPESIGGGGGANVGLRGEGAGRLGRGSTEVLNRVMC